MATPPDVDSYLATQPAAQRAALEDVRRTLRAALPDAQECISYAIPAFRQGQVLVYYAGFKHHIGLFPPVHGDAELDAALAPYRGEKGNLRFPLDQPLPLELVRRVALHRLAAVQAALATRAAKRKTRG